MQMIQADFYTVMNDNFSKYNINKGLKSTAKNDVYCLIDLEG